MKHSGDFWFSILLVAWFFGAVLGFYHGWSWERRLILPESRATENYYKTKCSRFVDSALKEWKP